MAEALIPAGSSGVTFGSDATSLSLATASSFYAYAQIIDDTSGKTLVSASTMDKDFAASGDKKSLANAVGKNVAARALENGIKAIVFDRNGYIYHGRIKSLSDGAREAGLKF